MELCEFARSPSDNPHLPIDLDKLIANAREGTNLFLIGEAGVGKTTTLIALCEMLLADSDSPLPIFVDATTWASSGKLLLEYIASFSAFTNVGLSTDALSRLNEGGKLLIVINGWNEIGVNIQADARERLQQFLAGSAMPRLIVATRSASDSLGIPKLKKVTVRGFTWEEQQTFIRQSLPEESASALLASLRTNSKLRAVTKNPLVLTGAISLHKSGQVVPDTLFYLLEAIVKDFESKDKRAASLRGAPLRGYHQTYLEAIAEALNNTALVSMQETETRSIVTKTIRLLEEQRGLSPRPDTSEVIEALCGHHLLHRGEDSVRFAHQRFQEFFGACVVLTRLDSALASDNEREAFKTKILNRPFWEDAIELAASKLAIDKSCKAQAELLIELALSVDLAYAAQLAGFMGLGNDNCSPWRKLRDTIEMMYRHAVPEARQYALHCAAATRSPEFAPLLWPLLENTDQEERLNGFQLAGGLTVHQLGPDATERMAQWSDGLRTKTVWELAERPENLEFIERLAYTDTVTSVRVAAIGALDFYYIASDTALDAWRKAPDAVKEEDSTLHIALEHWRPDDVALTNELLEVARRSANESVKRLVGLRLLGQAEEIGAEAARRAMREQYYERNSNTELVSFLKAIDPVFLKNLALEHISEGKRLNNWMRQELASLSGNERDAIALATLERLATVEHGNSDAAVAEGATESLVEKLLEEGLQLVALCSDRTSDEAKRRRLRAVERLLTCTASSSLIKAVLHRIESCSYDEAAWLAEVLNLRAGYDDLELGGVVENAPWRPDTSDLDTFIEVTNGKYDPREIPNCELEAKLVRLASKTDPVRYLELVLKGTRRHMQAFSAYDEALRRWLAEQPRHSPRPSNPDYGRWFVNALRRCGFDTVPDLLKMADEPGASWIVPEALVAIVSGPWEQLREKHTFLHDSYVKDHKNRRLMGRVFLQPDGTLQTITDEIAQFLVRKIDAITTVGGSLYVADVFNPSTQAHSFWVACILLSRVPSPYGLKTLHAILLREDAQVYPYLDIAQMLISQGGTLPSGSLNVIRSLWQHGILKEWRDDQARYFISRLVALHFFVEPAEAGLAQLKELLPEWLNKSPLWNIIDEIEKIPTHEALAILVELLHQCDSQLEHEERILRAICTNPASETANALLHLIEAGTFSKNSRKMYFLENSIAPRLKQAAVNDADFMQRLLAVLEAKGEATPEAFVCAVLGGMDDHKARMLICRYLDEQAYPQDGQSIVHVLLGLFRREVPIEPGSNCYKVHPQANQHLRRHLFNLASQQGPSQNRARALLLTLEQNRMESGRHSDENRHPAIETGNPWPICLYLIEEKSTSEEFQRRVCELEELATLAIDNESRELILIGHAFAIAGEAGQIFRPTPNSDWGIDGEIEFKDNEGKASGKRLYLQLKSGDSYLHQHKGNGAEIFTIKNERHAEYWQQQAYPVMLVIRTSDGTIRWMDVSEYLKRESDGGKKVVKQVVFKGEPFTAIDLRRLRDTVLGPAL